MSKHLVVTGLTNNIELAEINEEEGLIVGEREEMTQDVLLVTRKWFSANERSVEKLAIGDGRESALFHTTDKDKIKKIIEILGEE